MLNFKIRSLLIFIVLMSLIFGLIAMRRRAWRLESIADKHSRAEDRCWREERDARESAEVAEANSSRYAKLTIGSNLNNEDIKFYNELSIEYSVKSKSFLEFARKKHEEAYYHAKMRRKYRKAAARPWLPIGPDPLPP